MTMVDNDHKLLICKKYVISGRVQGVGYRAYTSAQAQKLGINGWVCNRPNGDVECTAVSTPEELAHFEKALYQGPPLSRVDSIQISSLPNVQYQGFKIVSNPL